MLLQQQLEKIMRKKKSSKLVSSCQYYCLLGTVHTTSSAGGFDFILVSACSRKRFYFRLPCVTRPSVCVTHAHFVVPCVWRLAPPMLTHLLDLRSALLTHPACGVVEFCYAHHFFVFFPGI